MAKFIDKILDKIDDYFSIFCTRKIHRFFRKCQRVNRSEHGRKSPEFIFILKYERENCHIQSANG